MKRVLVTGAGGAVGLQVIKYLLSEGKYEITAVDLKNKTVIKRLRGYKNRVNVIYADLSDKSLMDSLVRDHDYIIHLAGVSPVYVNYKEDLGKIDYELTQQLVNSISKNNPKCFLFYPSSMSVYGNATKYVTVDSKLTSEKFDHYSKYKIQSEKVVSKLNNYVIYRLAYVLIDPRNKTSFYNIRCKTMLETISLADAAYAFVAAIGNEKKINKKIFNVTGGEGFVIPYANYVDAILGTYGLSWKYIITSLCSEKCYYCSPCSDGDELEKLIGFRHKNINFFYDSLNKYISDVRRLFPRIFGLPFRACIKKYKNNR